MKKIVAETSVVLLTALGAAWVLPPSAVAQTGDYYRELDDYRNPSDSYGYGDRDRGRYGDDSSDEERRQLALERERLERERRNLESQRHESSRALRDECPPGFQQSERKCTEQERRRGCQDVRTSGGLGCVKR
jgi:hypothetical protein